MDEETPGSTGGENAEAPVNHRAVLGQVDTPVLVVDPQQTVGYANERACTVFGCEQSTLAGREVTALLYADGTTEIGARFEAAQEGNRQTLDCRSSDDLDTQFRATITLSPATVDDATQVVATFTAVESLGSSTAWTRSRDLLAQTELLTVSGGWELDCRTDELRWTDGTRRLHEVDSEYEATLESALSFYHDEDRPIIESSLDRAREAGESFDETLRLITATGRQRRVSIHGEPRVVEGETVLIQGAIQDVTARKDDERQLEMKSRALDQADIALTITDATESGKPLIYVNDAFLRMTGYTRDEVIGSNARFLRGPDTDPERAAAIEQAVENGEQATVDIRNYRNDGSMFWNRVRIRPFRQRGDEVTHFLDIQQDITERKRHKRQLEDQNERLEKFANVVSHDLRNPLNVAQLRINQVDDENAPPVQRSLDRMESILEDVLTIARVGQTVTETNDCHISRLATEAWEQVETEDATLSCEDDSLIETDPGRCKQLFENLFRNSIEHAGNDVTLRVGSTPGGFYVEDDGPGIPANKRETVFDAGFTTTDDGTGFGLNIVEDIAQAHGWSVDIVEGTDGGARFEFLTDGRPK
jgi:PAS domain S-box-containing protein